MIWFALIAVALGAFATGWVIGIAYGVQQEQEAMVDRLMMMERRRRQDV